MFKLHDIKVVIHYLRYIGEARSQRAQLNHADAIYYCLHFPLSKTCASAPGIDCSSSLVRALREQLESKIPQQKLSKAKTNNMQL